MVQFPADVLRHRASALERFRHLLAHLYAQTVRLVSISLHGTGRRTASETSSARSPTRSFACANRSAAASAASLMLPLMSRTVWRACGGPTRADTVARALADSGAADTDWVLVHDAARPGLSEEALARLIDACLPDPVGGLLALPVPDTIKQAKTEPDDREAVARTVDREGLWLAQTPQMFRAGMLRDALATALAGGAAITDEASAMEAAGRMPRLVRGHARNFKVTWPDDFDLMEKWL